jgi:NADH:ubiquinone oxidoreductase subunit 4 (subunit M)
VPAEPLELTVLTAASVALAVAFSVTRSRSGELLIRGGAGLGGIAAIALVPTLDVALVVLLALGLLFANTQGTSSFALRVRAPMVAVALLVLALAFARFEGPEVLQRFAAVGLVAGMAAAVGVLPYIHQFDPDESVGSSPVVWLAFVGPVLASVLVLRAQELLSPDAGEAFGGMLIGLGLLNVLWGGVGAWKTKNVLAAWRYSFIADWGLALAGFGLTVSDGRGGALLMLFGVVLCRFPLYLIARGEPGETTETERPINLVVAAAVAGSAPFAGFAARVLLLRGATQVFWPLALVLAVGMLLWLPGSLRLGRSLGRPRGRQALGVALVIAINLAAGVYPLPILSAGGF